MKKNSQNVKIYNKIKSFLYFLKKIFYLIKKIKIKVVIDAHLKEISKFFWDEKRKILITGSYDKGIKVFQLPIYWPSELVRKYKSKNNKKILLSNAHIKSDKEAIEYFEKAQEKLEAEETRMQNKSPFNHEENERNLDNQENKNDKSKVENNEKSIDKEENKGESNIDTIEDDDFLILKSVAKLKHGLSDREKVCEDLHGWDEDF